MKVFTSEIYSFQNRDFFFVFFKIDTRISRIKIKKVFVKKNKFEEEKFVTVLIIDSAPEILKK